MAADSLRNSRQKNKQQNKRNMPKKNLWADFVIYALVLAVIIWGGFAYRDNYYRKHLDWQTAYAGSLDDTIEATALVVRDESLLKAPASGVLRKAVDVGTRVNGGTVIAYIDAPDGKSYAVSAPKSGIVQFAVDGLEQILSINSYKSIDIEQLFSLIDKEGLQDTSVELIIGKSVQGGDIIGKLYDNLVDYYMVVYTQHEHDLGDIGTLTLKLSDGSSLRGKVAEQGHLSNGQYYILKFSTTSDTELLTRCLAVSFTGSRVTGIIVPYSALVEQEDGSYKVFYRKKNAIAETEVRLLGYKEDLAVIEGVEDGTDIVAQPRYARIGAKAFE